MLNRFSPAVISIIKREFKAQAFTKAFVISTILVPIIIVGLMGFQTFLMMFKDDKPVNLVLALENAQLIPYIEKEFKKSEENELKRYTINYQVVEPSRVKEFVESKKSKLIDKSLNGIFYVHEVRADKKLDYYSKNPKNANITKTISKLVDDALIAYRFYGKGLNASDIEYSQSRPSLNRFKVSKEGILEKDNFGAFILAGAFAFMLYMSLILIGTQMLRAVVEEKENRVVELLLSSVNATELMLGKIIATSAVGLLQILVWSLPLVLSSSMTFLMLPEEFQFTVSLTQISVFVSSYLLGLISFLGLYAAVGAVFDNMSDAQQGASPIIFIIMIPFYICFTMLKDPTNIIAEISSMVPFASVIVMPVRTAMMEVPGWQIATSMVVNLATLLFIFSFVGKIYRIGLLKTGSRPKWKEIYQWARQ